mgnify:CR=1 FL=1|tara:strand:- start:127435 stop:127680 length:246 start_codon:yes stop_codon:yes gene_type:complete
MDRYLCKATYFDGNGDITFEKGVWYKQDSEPILMDFDDLYYYSIIPENNERPWFIVDSDKFNRHFYSVDELRELEIDKVLL